MTIFKQLSIPEGEAYLIEKLKDVSPVGKPFSECIRDSMREYIEKRAGIDLTENKMPSFDAPFNEWVSYLQNNPSIIPTLVKQHSRMGNILKLVRPYGKI